MKRIITLCLAIAPVCAIAAAPSTSCPSGYVTVVEEHMDIANSSPPAGHVLCMRQWAYRIQTPLARMNLNRRVQWNKIPATTPECPPPHFGAGGCRAEHDGGWGTMTTPPRWGTPPQRGTLPCDGTYLVPLHWRGGT